MLWKILITYRFVIVHAFEHRFHWATDKSCQLPPHNSFHSNPHQIKYLFLDSCKRFRTYFYRLGCCTFLCLIESWKILKKKDNLRFYYKISNYSPCGANTSSQVSSSVGFTRTMATCSIVWGFEFKVGIHSSLLLQATW